MSSFSLTKPGEAALSIADHMVFVLLDPSINKFVVFTDTGEWFVTVMGNRFNDASYLYVPVDT